MKIRKKIRPLLQSDCRKSPAGISVQLSPSQETNTKTIGLLRTFYKERRYSISTILMPISSAVATRVSRAYDICSGLCSLITSKRRRALFLGTAG